MDFIGTQVNQLALKSSNLEDFLTVTYCIVDELYQPLAHLVKRPGPSPRFSDSELICLHLVGQMMYDSQLAWYNYVAKNYLHLFPDLLEASRYHRRCKALQKLIEIIREHLLIFMQTHLQSWHVMDSMPIPVCKYSRAGRNKRFAYQLEVEHSSLYGHCASQKQDIYGFKLHLMVTAQGIPVHYLLAPSAHHDVTIAPELLESYRENILVLFDKGYVGLPKRMIHPENYQLVIQQRDNQKENTKAEKMLLAQFRKTIETTNSILTEQFNIQYTRAKTAWGLKDKIIAKITACTYLIFLNFILKENLLDIKSFIF